jgi:chloramphenicol O-acetyltransferase
MSLKLAYSQNHASVPMISTDKLYDYSGINRRPIAITSSHALIDAYHVGQFLDCLTTAFSDPEAHMSLSG